MLAAGRDHGAWSLRELLGEYPPQTKKRGFAPRFSDATACSRECYIDLSSVERFLLLTGNKTGSGHSPCPAHTLADRSGATNAVSLLARTSFSIIGLFNSMPPRWRDCSTCTSRGQQMDSRRDAGQVRSRVWTQPQTCYLTRSTSCAILAPIRRPTGVGDERYPQSRVWAKQQVFWRVVLLLLRLASRGVASRWRTADSRVRA
jgi:hypothetical protein